jgi:hypothetical protein
MLLRCVMPGLSGWYANSLQPDTHFVNGNRTGVRASSIGEVPYLDPNSNSRREALGIPVI